MKELPKVLVVHDNPEYLLVTREILESKPYRVETALSGEEGLDKAKKHKPDIIILDITEGKPEPLEMFGQLKNDRELKRIPVLMFTSPEDKLEKGDSYLMHQGTTLEADDYIDKSFSPAELLRRVDRLLRQ